MNQSFGFFFVSVALATAGLAQSFTGTVLGRVFDPTDSAVANAEVIVINTGTNVSVKTFTDGSGNYTLPLLPAGSYVVEASARGFKKFRQEGVRLQVQQQARVDIRLEVGELVESVNVVSDAAVVETTTSSVGKVVDNKRIRDLPLNTRNVYSLVFLTPGVQGSVGNSHNQVGYSVNGVRSGLMDTLVDGVTAAFPTVNGFHGISVFPSVDAVEEFKVQGQNFSAEFGRSLGSVLNLVYKSGTNQFHGSLYNFLRNSVLDANNFFNNARGVALASFKRNQFGGMASGPVRRDRTFFMVSYEGLRQRSFRERLDTVPTALQRQGDFSETLAGQNRLIQIFDPLTTRQEGTGFVRAPFPGNRVPADRFDPVARNVLRWYPQPNQPGLPFTQQLNFYNSGSAQVDTNNLDVRIDHNLSSRQRIFGRYSYRRSLDAPPQLFPGELGVAEGRINLNDWGTSAVFDYTNTLSSTAVASVRIGFARNKFLFDNQGLGFVPSSLGLPRELDNVVDRRMFPRFGVAGQVNLGGSDHRQSGFNSWSLLPSVSRISGRHSLKVGYEGRMLPINVWEARDAGNFAFSAGFTQGPNALAASATAGYGFASFLLGAGSAGNLFQNWKNVASLSFYNGFYIQDDWRVNRRLTLNLGLRYDFDAPRTERFNRMSWWDPNVRSPLAGRVAGFPELRGGLQFVGVGGNSRKQYDGDYNNIAPRLGLAYQVKPKTVLRAAFGQLFGPSTLAAQGTVGPYGFRVETPWITTLDGVTPLNYLRNPFPGGFQAVPGAGDGLLTGVGGRIEGPLRDTNVPYTLQWNFTVQQELPGRVLLELGYVATAGRQLSLGGESGNTANQLRPELMSLGTQLNQQVANPFFGIVTRGVLANPTVSRAQLLRPYPQFLDVIPLFYQGGSSNYQSMQLTVSRRYSDGFVFEGNYVWSKTIDDGTSHQDAYNRRISRSVVSIHRPHRAVLSGVYELPVGRRRRLGGNWNRAADLVLGGWQVNGIWLVQSGAPIGIAANNTAGVFGQAIRANNNGTSASLDGPARQRLTRWFNTSVFSQPAPFTFGNVGPLLPDVRAHFENNVDLSVGKNFVLREGLQLQFRAEAFNALNRVQFSGPNTNVNSGAAFGTVNTQANAARQVQFGLKLLW